MGRAVIVDCFSGASGDMLLGALVDAGVSIEQLRQGLSTLPVRGWRLDAEPARQHGISGTRAHVQLEEQDQPHRGLADVLRVIDSGSLPHQVAERARAVFTRLGEVEAHIHATSVDAVEFHEVGAIDAIVDVVGVVLGLYLLGADWGHITCSGLPLGSGWVGSAHGRLPVPAPATLELMRRAAMPVRAFLANPAADETGELTTPTGAALLTVLARQGGAQNGFTTLERIGYGFGAREPTWPNAVRLLVGPSSEAPPDGLLSDTVSEIQTNLDDASPEELGFAMERLLEAGALDVAFSPLYMKKNRPGVLVRVLARPEDGRRLAGLVLEHTSALGVRLQRIERLVAWRQERSVSTPWGDVRVKVKQLGERELVAPEYEDCARLARAAHVPLSLVYDAARSASSG
jgi:uncharacterized protein (TIGR00299 family) protein